jgi:hypothetical protein
MNGAAVSATLLLLAGCFHVDINARATDEFERCLRDVDVVVKSVSVKILANGVSVEAEPFIPTQVWDLCLGELDLWVAAHVDRTDLPSAVP